MNIGGVSSISGSYGYQQGKNTVKSGSVNDFSQSIILEANKQIDLGTIDGKPFKMKLFIDGGFEWSGGLFLKAPQGGSKVSPEHAAAAYAFDSYTRAEREKAQDIGGVICALYQVTNRGQKTSFFNSFINNSGKKFLPEETKDALGLIGINPDKPFTINGRTFVFDSGTLKNYAEVK